MKSIANLLKYLALVVVLFSIFLPEAYSQKTGKGKTKTIKLISSDSDQVILETDTLYLTSDNDDEEMVIINVMKSGKEVEAIASYSTTGTEGKDKIITVVLASAEKYRAEKGDACVIKSVDGKTYSIIIKEIDKPVEK